VSVTVLIVDDHEEFRRTARELLEAEEFEVVGEASDGESALEEIVTLRPELVLLDVQLPGIDGFEVAARLADAPFRPLVVLTSTRGAASYRRRLAEASLAFISKDDLSAAALAAVVG
jgi:DNA-binding NarL/FixJ family response regulator